MQKILVGDVETTGTVNPIFIVEVAWSEIDEDLEIISEFTTLVNPGVHIPCSATAIHGIRDQDVVDAPKITEVNFPKEEIILIAHNSDFDEKLLSPHMNIVGCIDTLRLARRLLKESEGYSLAELACYCGLPIQVNHRAPADVRNVVGLVDFFNREYGMSLQDMYDESNRCERLAEMPWGKHKGMKMEFIPREYMLYLLNSGMSDKDVKYTFELILGQI